MFIIVLIPGMCGKPKPATAFFYAEGAMNWFTGNRKRRFRGNDCDNYVKISLAKIENLCEQMIIPRSNTGLAGANRWRAAVT